MYLRSFEIEGLFHQYFDGYPGVDIEFDFREGTNVIIGANGTGKTTALKLLNEFFGWFVRNGHDQGRESSHARPLNNIVFDYWDDIADPQSFVWQCPFKLLKFQLSTGEDDYLIVRKNIAGSVVERSDFLDLEYDGHSIRVVPSTVWIQDPEHPDDPDQKIVQRRSPIASQHLRHAENICAEIIYPLPMHIVETNRINEFEFGAEMSDYISPREPHLLAKFVDDFFSGKYLDVPKPPIPAGIDQSSFHYSMRLQSYNPTYSMGGAADQDIIQWDQLSSGELHAFMMMGQILSARRGSLVLIDEPEISLHVEWQEELIPWLEQAAEIAECNLVITTHSPSILHNHDCSIIMLPQAGTEANSDD